jgi:hypothetical protein
MDYIYSNLPLTTVVDPATRELLICHIGNVTYGSSLCGLRKITYASMHTKRACFNDHQMCIVCLSEYERIKGETYFPEGWSDGD